MSTRSSIAILNQDETVTSIYCHWDGYPEHNGKILLAHYNTEEVIRKLLSYGDLSVLAPEIGEKHDFRDGPEGVCTFYHRDRGDKDVWAQIHPSLEAYNRSLGEAGQQWAYLFADGVWICTPIGGKRPYTYRPLKVG